MSVIEADALIDASNSLKRKRLTGETFDQLDMRFIAVSRQLILQFLLKTHIDVVAEEEDCIL